MQPVLFRFVQMTFPTLGRANRLKNWLRPPMIPGLRAKEEIESERRPENSKVVTLRALKSAGRNFLQKKPAKALKSTGNLRAHIGGAAIGVDNDTEKPYRL